MDKTNTKNELNEIDEVKTKYLKKNFNRQLKLSVIYTPVITFAILINLGLFKKNKWNAFLNVNNLPIIKKYSIYTFITLSLLGTTSSLISIGSLDENLSTKELKQKYIKSYPKKEDKK